MCRYLKYLGILAVLCVSLSLPGAALADEGFSFAPAADDITLESDGIVSDDGADKGGRRQIRFGYGDESVYPSAQRTDLDRAAFDPVEKDPVEKVPYCNVEETTFSQQDCVTRLRGPVQALKRAYTGIRRCVDSPCASYKKTIFDDAGGSVTELLDLDLGDIVVMSMNGTPLHQILSEPADRIGTDRDVGGGIVRMIASFWPVMQQNQERVIAQYVAREAGSLGPEKALRLGQQIAVSESAATIRALALKFDSASDRRVLWTAYLAYAMGDQTADRPALS